MIAALAQARDDHSGNVVTGGTSTAFTLTALTEGVAPDVDLPTGIPFPALPVGNSACLH